MGIFSHLSLFLTITTAFIFISVDAESLRQRIFKENDGPCTFEQYKCLNNRCVPRNKLCNGINDCMDNSDESYCSRQGSCPIHLSFFCGPNSNYRDKCIPMSWKCDGYRDCSSGLDEEKCNTQALAVLALACAAKQPYEVFDMVEINELTMELKKRQYRNGTVENLKTTALVLQALFASENEADEDNFDEEKALKQIIRLQDDNGSFGNIPNTYYVLPVLGCKSLVNISSSHCKAPIIDDKDTLMDLMNKPGEKKRTQFSLWIGNNRTVERTLTLNVPANSSFYQVMEFAAGLDSRFKFDYSLRNGKPYIYSISDIQDDPESGMFWFFFKTSSSNGDLEPIAKSPADVVPSDKQHFIFWYKYGSWNQ